MTRPGRTMTAAELLDVVEVERLTLGPGDMLVLKHCRRLSDAEVGHIHEQMRAALPDTKILLLEDGMDIAVLKAGE